MKMWYVDAQLRKFQKGWRGGHPDDVAGLRMRPMSNFLLHKSGDKRGQPNDDDIRAVTAYISQMPSKRPAPTMEGGDPKRGKELFATCTVCHGPDAKGNISLNAPNLTLTNDWYLATQLRNFKGGIRGANSADTIGAQMAPMAATLPDEQAIKDVVAYIGTL
jgi:cytochrome c oxidase subunit 2